MAFADDLLEQAMDLAQKDPTRPRQANLRRAVSSAYYAVFHTIVDRAVASVLSRSDSGGSIGGRLRRVVQHGAIDKAARWFTHPQRHVPPAVSEMLGGVAPSHSGRAMFESIIELQKERYLADYNLLSVRFARTEVVRRVHDAKLIVGWLEAPDPSDELRVFLLGCLFGEALTRNA